MDCDQKVDPAVILPADRPPPSFFLSLREKPNPDSRSNRWKSTKSARSQSGEQQILEGDLQLKRISTVSPGTYEMPEADYQRMKLEALFSHQEDRSVIYNQSIRYSQTSRGISIIDDNEDMNEPLEFGSFVAWLLLILSSISNAIVPCWMTVDVNVEGHTRSAWRVFITSILLIPFVLCEQRQVKLPGEYFRALLSRENLQKHFIFSLNYSIWVLIGSMALKLTARSHSFTFLRLKFFFISIRKFFRREDYYQSEMAGTILVAIGALMVIWDSWSLPVEPNPLAFYLSYSQMSRICGDLLSVLGSVVILYFQSNYSMPKTPRFSNLLLNNLCLCVNLVTMGYFFGGNEFSLDPVRGVFGLFTRENFVNVFYVSIMLGLNLIIGNLLVDKIFSAFIRNVASCLEPVVTVTVYHMFSIEVLTPGTACLGLAFLVPGMMLIVGGQNFLQKEEIKINFLIYKEEEKHFLSFAKQTYRQKLMAKRETQGQGQEPEIVNEQDNSSFEDSGQESYKKKYD